MQHLFSSIYFHLKPQTVVKPLFQCDRFLSHLPTDIMRVRRVEPYLTVIAAPVVGIKSNLLNAISQHRI
jgi:hypothetical protein